MEIVYRKLTLSDLILNRDGSLVFKLILSAFGIALRLFFRRIETVNAHTLPQSGGIIFVLNHPNGLIDPAMVFVALPRKISFLAKSTLFKMPVISYLLKTVDALPLYRKIDKGEDVSKNTETFRLAGKLLEGGGAIALFPEGVSHNSPKLLPMKTGAARIALGSLANLESGGEFELRIVPVGLYYTNKTTFRSEALLHFGEPFLVEKAPCDADGNPSRDAVKKLTDKIEAALKEVTVNAENEAELHSAHIAEEIFAAAAINENLGEKLDFLQNYLKESDIVDDGGRRYKLNKKLKEFDGELNKFGLEPYHLSLGQYSGGFVLRQALIRIWWLALLLPLALVGWIVHFPAYQICKFVAEKYASHDADDVASTAKVLAGMVFMPATWLIISAVIYYFWGWQFALPALPLGFLVGYIALYVIEEMTELFGWAKAIALFFTEREKFLRLFVERRNLQQELQEFDQ